MIEAPVSGRRGSWSFALLVALLITTYIWWRISAQYRDAEAFWTNPLTASAENYRTRAVAWLAARRDVGDVLASLLTPNGDPTDAFMVAAATVLGNDGVEFVTLRVGNTNRRCVRPGEHARVVCVQGTQRYAIPSIDHAQAKRVRPVIGGRVLVPMVTAIRGNAGGGVLTQWVDPEVALIPEVLRTRGSVPGASTTLVRRDGPFAVVMRADTSGRPRERWRLDAAELPSLLGRPPVEGELIRGNDADGVDAIGVATYVTPLRSFLYRSVPRETAFAAFRKEVTTEAVLSFLLGSFLFGLFVWNLRERREQQIHAALVQARLDSLEAQLRPHFLFNALSTVATLVHEDANAAERMLVRLADLLRVSLEESEHALIPVHRELRLLDAFLSLERVRFGSALRVTVHTGSDVNDLMVPRWVLQPLVENAIKHGGAYSRGEASISIAVARHQNRLVIVVADDGVSRADATAPRVEGVGLRNTRRRLESLFGSDASIVLRKSQSEGFEVIVTIPVSHRARRGKWLRSWWRARRPATN